MDEAEYERRKRALEQIYLADLELVQAAHAARLRSLEALRTSTAGAPAASGPAPAPVPPQRPPVAQAPATPADLPPRPYLRPALEGIFPQLPEVFEKSDVARALGWTPNRSSLQRVLSEMAREGFLQFLETSGGRTPSRYKKKK